MKIDQGSSFQKLIAGKVPQERVDSDPPKGGNALPQNSIEKAAQGNEDAASTITRVASVDSSDSANSSNDLRARQDVEASVRAAAETKPEDVSNLADLVASRIRQSPDEALVAHKDPNVEKIHQLLQ